MTNQVFTGAVKRELDELRISNSLKAGRIIVRLDCGRCAYTIISTRLQPP